MNEPENNKRPQARPGVMEIRPYQPGKSGIEGQDQVIKLSSNESPLGPSPFVTELIRQADIDAERYPDSDAKALRAQIGESYHIDPAYISVGAGSDQILAQLARIYAGSGNEILQPENAFVAYRISAAAAGATSIFAPERNFTTDVDALLERVTANTRLLFLANPNNPTGTMIAADELHRLRAGLRSDILLVIDSAYSEYSEREDYSDGHDLVAEALASGAENVVVSPTLSKIYGLAALRLGWCYGTARVIDVLGRVRQPFNVSTLTQLADIAALKDQDHIAKARAHNSHWLPKLSKSLQDLGLEVTPGVGNFLLVHFGSKTRASAADNYLKDHGIIIRPLGPYGLHKSLRITIGKDLENEALIGHLEAFVS